MLDLEIIGNLFHRDSSKNSQCHPLLLQGVQMGLSSSHFLRRILVVLMLRLLVYVIRGTRLLASAASGFNFSLTCRAWSGLLHGDYLASLSSNERHRSVFEID